MYCLSSVFVWYILAAERSPLWSLYFFSWQTIGLKNSHGQYSDNQVARCSRITGSLGKSVEDVFQHNIIDRHMSSSKSSTFSDNINMSKFLHTYLKENLFKKNERSKD